MVLVCELWFVWSAPLASELGRHRDPATIPTAPAKPQSAGEKSETSAAALRGRGGDD